MDLLDGNIELSKNSLIYRTDKEKGIKFYTDSDFAGGWDQADANNAENVISHTKNVITYVGCPILWCSRLKT